MPTYEYECDECQYITEHECSFKERFDAPECPKCGKPTHQIISTVSFVLKGAGWARDGYGGATEKNNK